MRLDDHRAALSQFRSQDLDAASMPKSMMVPKCSGLPYQTARGRLGCCIQERCAMRMILSFIVGVAVTIGGAYVHDSSLPDKSPQRLVNWDAARDLGYRGMERARDEFGKLTAK
jgi:hypothetical protein